MKRLMFAGIAALAAALAGPTQADAQVFSGRGTHAHGGGTVFGGRGYATPFGYGSTSGYYSPYGNSYGGYGHNHGGYGGYGHNHGGYGGYGGYGHNHGGYGGYGHHNGHYRW